MLRRRRRLDLLAAVVSLGLGASVTVLAREACLLDGARDAGLHPPR